MFPLILYVAGVVLVNIGFSYIPPIMTPLGMFAPMAIFVGAIFVLRDYAQRSLGHWVLGGMVIAAIISYLMADPYVAMASVLAFATSETADWLLYTWTKRPFHERVLISSAISVPIDTAVFLLAIQHMTAGTFLIMCISKMFAAVVIWWWYATSKTPQAV